MTDLISAYTAPEEHCVELNVDDIVSDDNVDDEYAQQLAEHDTSELPPIIVLKHPEKQLYAVLDGHHRLRAARIRKTKTIRAVVVDDYTGLGFDLTRRGMLQPSKEVTRYIRVPLKRFTEQMRSFLFD